MIDFASAHYRTDTHGCALITVLSAFARPGAFDPLSAAHSPLHKRSSKPLRLFVLPLAAEREETSTEARIGHELEIKKEKEKFEIRP